MEHFTERNNKAVPKYSTQFYCLCNFRLKKGSNLVIIIKCDSFNYLKQWLNSIGVAIDIIICKGWFLETAI